MRKIFALGGGGGGGVGAVFVTGYARSRCLQYVHSEQTGEERTVRFLHCIQGHVNATQAIYSGDYIAPYKQCKG
jgi:hypothetical protein